VRAQQIPGGDAWKLIEKQERFLAFSYLALNHGPYAYVTSCGQ
jgi:hypothetical protein